jgi:maleylacetoacetate isomerase
MCDIVGCDIQPVTNLKILVRASEKEETKEAKDAAKAAWGAHYTAEGFTALEAAVAETAGTYCFGDIVTLADVYLAPAVFNAARFGVDMTRFPTLKRICDSLNALDAFARAMPTAQPDAVV